jgi:hypothetical protein
MMILKILGGATLRETTNQARDLTPCPETSRGDDGGVPTSGGERSTDACRLRVRWLQSFTPPMRCVTIDRHASLLRRHQDIHHSGGRVLEEATICRCCARALSSLLLEHDSRRSDESKARAASRGDELVQLVERLQPSRRRSRVLSR